MDDPDWNAEEQWTVRSKKYINHAREALWYFVDSKKQFENYLTSDTFNFYTDDGCFGKNYHSFSGICKNIDHESGLLIIIPDDLNRSLTKIKVNLHEKI